MFSATVSCNAWKECALQKLLPRNRSSRIGSNGNQIFGASETEPDLVSSEVGLTPCTVEICMCFREKGRASVVERDITIN